VKIYADPVYLLIEVEFPNPQSKQLEICCVAIDTSWNCFL